MSQQLVINTDGGSRGNPGPAAWGVIVHDQANQVVWQQAEFIGVATNNEAEYAGFIASARWLLEHQRLLQDQQTQQLESIEWRLDSKLVVEQLNRHWKIKEPRLQKLAQDAWQLLAQLQAPYRIIDVRRAFNAEADALLNAALDQHA